MNLNHFACPTCDRLCSVPWGAAWCLHNDRPSAMPPSWIDSDWDRMLSIEGVWTLPLPPIADEWYVEEHRNPYGYPNNEIPGEDKRTVKIVAGPLSRKDAYAFAEAQPRDDVAEYIHSFRALPGDLV